MKVVKLTENEEREIHRRLCDVENAEAVDVSAGAHLQKCRQALEAQVHNLAEMYGLLSNSWLSDDGLFLIGESRS